MPKTKQIPVIIRYEGPSRADRKDWHLSDVVAVFPEEPGTNNPRTMTCYSSIGQHGACVSGFIGDKTKPATPAQVKAMLKELHKIGYRNLRVVSKIAPAHDKARRATLGRFTGK